MGRGRTLLVVPDSARAEVALRQLAAAGAVDASGVLSFAQLVELLLPAPPRTPRAAAPLVSRALISAEARRLGPGPFGAFSAEPEFARAALALVLEVKSAGASPAELSRAAERSAGARAARLAYLASLAEAYQAKLTELRLADAEDLLSAATLALDQDEPGFVSDFSEVLIQDMYDFSPSRLGLVAALARRCRRAGGVLTLELPASGAPEVDGVVDDALRQLERQWETLELEVRKRDDADRGRPLAAIAPAVFADGGRFQGPVARLTCHGVASPAAEAALIARQVQGWLDDGAALESIAVAFRGLGPDAEPVLEALAEVGVPARLRLGAPLKTTAVGHLALELPLLIDDGFPAPLVSTLLESRYLPAVSAGASGATAAILASAGIKDDRVGAVGARGAYELRLTALSERHRHPSAVAHVRERFLRLKEILTPLGDERSLGGHLAAWWRSLEELGMFQAARQLEPRGAEHTPRGRAAMRGLARDQAAVDALEAAYVALHEAFGLSREGARVTSPRGFHAWLADAAQDVNLAPNGPRQGAVQLLDVRDLVGLELEHVHLGGLVEGRFPSRASEHWLLSAEDRAGVNAALGRRIFSMSRGDLDEPLPPQLAEDRLLFHLALCAATSSASLSWARRGARGEELAPSPFVSELVRKGGCAVRVEPARVVPTVDEVASEAELRLCAALAPDAPARALSTLLAGEAWLSDARRLAEIERERLRFFSNPGLPPGRFSGAVAVHALGRWFDDRLSFGPERPLSATTLRAMGTCGFKALLLQVVGLGEPTVAGEEMDARGRGSFWHHVLERLVPVLKARGLLGAPLEELPDGLIEATVDETLMAHAASEHVGHPALFDLTRHRAVSMVRRLLGSEGGPLPFEGQEPIAYELAFGVRDAPEAWRSIAIPAAFEGERAVHVRGEIDRLDSDGRSVAVIDYKGGGKVSAKKVRESLLVSEFQLPLYLFAARAAGHGPDLVAAWLYLKTGDLLRLDHALGPDFSVSELLEVSAEARAAARERARPNLANATHALLAKLRAGDFAPRPTDCGLCTFRPVCRITERRAHAEGGVDG